MEVNVMSPIQNGGYAFHFYYKIAISKGRLSIAAPFFNYTQITNCPQFYHKYLC